jgi:enoyl-CoA hydratase/carnithine racemase
MSIGACTSRSVGRIILDEPIGNAMNVEMGAAIARAVERTGSPEVRVVRCAARAEIARAATSR